VANDDRVDWRAAIAHFSGAIAYVWHAGLHAGAVADALGSCGFVVRAQIIWQKSHFVLGRGDYHWGHEPCWYAVRKGRPSAWRGDRTQSTVWSVPNLNPIGGARGAENVVTGHSTQKPVRLFEIPILAHTEPGAHVYDPFVGSGTALIAAEKTGRACYAIELEPRYVQAAIDRWEQFSGQTAQRVDPADR
jgi:DNA modification methylase